MDKRELEFDAGIRQKLSEGSIDFDEAAWAKMEQRLTGRKGRLAVIPLWRQAAAIILLAGLGFWIYSAYFTNQTEQPPLAENDLYPGTDAPLTGRQAEQPDVPHTDNNTDKPDANEPDAGKGSGTTNQGLIPATDTDEEIYALTAASEGRYPHTEAGERVLVKRIENLPETRWPVVQPDDRGIMLARSGERGLTERQPRVEPVASGNEGVTWSLSVLAAPDLNGVRGLGDKKIGFNAGVGLGFQLSERLSVHTGIVYSKKPYNAAPSDYHTRYSPQGLMNIAAECDVIDIPLNLRYTLFQKGHNRVSVHAGLSSYLMLREHYRYEFGADAPRDYDYRNENQHFMGVGNAGIMLERSLGSGVSLGLKPFVKVPLTGIGHGDVRLVSAGAAIQLNLGIGKKTRINK